jgi:NAD(P)-dependent dehydrogenase (short-subunit alcohol dehydrogenase family)
MRFLKYWLPSVDDSAGRAYVLGAQPDSGNIGESVANVLHSTGWDVIMDDGATGDGSRPRGGNIPDAETAARHGYSETDKGWYQRFEAPSVDEFRRRDPDALIITLGKTAKTHFAEINDWDVGQMIKANLVLPLEAARRFVQACEQPGVAGARLRGDRLENPRTRWIIFTGSYAHDHPFTNGTLYCAAKAGLNMAARTLAWELTDRGYRVACVNPHHVPGTPMWSEVERGVMESKGWTKEQADEYAHRDLKMPRHLSPEDIAWMVHTLLTVPAAEWLSGAGLDLYGGTR